LEDDMFEIEKDVSTNELTKMAKHIK